MEKTDMQEDDNENGNEIDDEGEIPNDDDDPMMQDNMQHQENRPKYNSA